MRFRPTVLGNPRVCPKIPKISTALTPQPENPSAVSSGSGCLVVSRVGSFIHCWGAGGGGGSPDNESQSRSPKLLNGGSRRQDFMVLDLGRLPGTPDLNLCSACFVQRLWQGSGGLEVFCSVIPIMKRLKPKP